MTKALVVVALLAFAFNSRSDCNFDASLKLAYEEISKTEPLVVGSGKYSQILRFPNGSEEILKSQMDYALREIPVAIMDVADCGVKIALISRTIGGGRLSLPKSEESVKLAPRAFGPIWNDFNTQFAISGKVVLLVKWKRFTSADHIYYVPYSEDLHKTFPFLVSEGEKHFEGDIEEALLELRKRGFLDSYKGPPLRKLLKTAFLSESIDPFEFKFNENEAKARISEHPFVTLGANGANAYVHKVSHMGARGPMQIWGPTCSDLRRINKKAELSLDCNGAAWGSHSHIGNIAAAALEFIWHAETIERKFGPNVRKRNDFARMLLASYNGGPGWVIKAHRDYGENWDKLYTILEGKKGKRTKKVAANSIRPETSDYLLKCDYLLSKQGQKMAQKMSEAK